MLFFISLSAQQQTLCDETYTEYYVDISENGGEGTSNAEYQWQIIEADFEGEITTLTNSGNQIEIHWGETPPGYYTLWVQETDTLTGCVGEPQEIVIAFQIPAGEEIEGSDQLCVGEINTYTHTYDGGIWTIAGDNAQINQSGELEALHAGTELIRYTFETNNCTFEVEKEITIHPRPKPELTDVSLCIDPETGEYAGPVYLDAGYPEEEYAFEWFYEETLLSNQENTLEVWEPGTYSVVVTRLSTGCVSNPVSVEVAESTPPKITASVASDFNDRQVIRLSVEGEGDFLYRLEGGEYQGSSRFEIVGKEQNLTVYVKTPEGCEVSIDVNIINYPKFFTPNNDGQNDTWNITSLRHDRTAKIYIFDRFGKLLKTIHPYGTPWDGTYHGKKMPSNDYWFLVEYTDTHTGERKKFRANITLKR